MAVSSSVTSINAITQYQADRQAGSFIKARGSVTFPLLPFVKSFIQLPFKLWFLTVLFMISVTVLLIFCDQSW